MGADTYRSLTRPRRGLTVRGTGDDVDWAYTAGFVGVNIAVSECVPFGRVVTVRAKPAVSGTGAFSAVVPSMN